MGFDSAVEFVTENCAECSEIAESDSGFKFCEECNHLIEIGKEDDHVCKDGFS